jgi:hypothetical protein
MFSEAEVVVVEVMAWDGESEEGGVGTKGGMGGRGRLGQGGGEGRKLRSPTVVHFG